MKADPFQVDLDNLCHHLRQRLIAKRVSSNFLEIIDNNIPHDIIENKQPNQNYGQLSREVPFSLLNIPKELRFDEQSLNSPELGLPPTTESIFLRLVSYQRRYYQV